MNAQLKRSHDRKVSTWHNYRGGNSFGLPAGVSCPGMTSLCGKVCYAKKIERMPYLKAVRDNLRHNWDLLKDATFSEMVVLLAEMIGEFRDDCEKGNIKKQFRIHWDGDFFSKEYAAAWAAVISGFPDVQFWAYTRSFEFVSEFNGLPNLALYLSVDKENISAARNTWVAFPFVKWAYLDETMASAGDVLKTETGRPGAKCPENIGAIPLIENRVGACISCGLCVKGKADVRFSISKA